MSKNRPTIEAIQLSCRHVIEHMDKGLSENWAIRLLEQQTNMYGKFRSLGYVAPDRVDQYELWSKAARKAMRATPKGKTGQFLRVEHGTPKRAFAREVLAEYKKSNKLTEEWMDQHCELKWKVAVITHEEDARLRKLGVRSKAYPTPEERWAAAGIEF